MKKFLFFLVFFMNSLSLCFGILDYDKAAKEYIDFEKFLQQEGITKDKIERIFFPTLSDDIINVVVTEKIGTYKLYVTKRKKQKYVTSIIYHDTLGSR